MISISNKKHWLLEQAEKDRNKTALITNRAKINYLELLKSSEIIARYLSENGIAKGSNVGLIYNYNVQFIETINALWFLGVVPIIVNTRNNSQEINSQLEDADVNYIIIENSLIRKFKNLKIKQINITNRKLINKNLIFPKFNLKNEALILFTSGSSGKQKGVVHTFSSLFESCKLLDNYCNLSKKDIWLTTLPNYHVGGFMIFIRSFLSGATVALTEKYGSKNILNSLKNFNPTHISLVSTQLKLLLEVKCKPNLKLKHLFLGGGPIETNLCSDAISKGFPITKVYGSTETCSMVTALSKKDFIIRPNSSGKALKGVQIKVLNNNNKHVVNKSGIIIIKSKSLMKKYYEDVSRSNYYFQNNYYKTNDIGRIDDDGFLFIESRNEDIIISGGENISAREVENAIKLFRNIVDAYVFGIKDSKWGEKVVAVLSAKNKIDKKKLNEHLRRKLSHFKIPKKIIYVKSLPKNELGKINKKEILSLFELNKE